MTHKYADCYKPAFLQQVTAALGRFALPLGGAVACTLAADGGGVPGMLGPASVSLAAVLANVLAGRAVAGGGERQAPPWSKLVNHDLQRALRAAFHEGLLYLADVEDMGLRRHGRILRKAAEGLDKRWASVDLDTDFPWLAQLLGPGIAVGFAENGAELIEVPLGEVGEWHKLLERLFDPAQLPPGVAEAMQTNCLRWFLYELRNDPAANNALQSFLQGDCLRKLDLLLEETTGIQEVRVLCARSMIADNPSLLNPLTRWPCWADVVCGNTFRRTLTDSLLEWLKEPSSNYRQRVIVAGSGTGKSVALMQMAVAAANEGFSALWVRKHGDAPAVIPGGGRVVLFVDRAAGFPFRQWEQQYTARDLTIIAAEQESVWRSSQGSPTLDELRLQTLDETEVARFDELLCGLDQPVGRAKTPWRGQHLKDRRKLLGDPRGADLLEVLVELETGKDITNHVRDELARVTPEARDACLLVAWPGAADLAMPEEVVSQVVAREQKTPLPEHWPCRHTLENEAAGLLIRDGDEWRLRHRRFAQAALQADLGRAGQLLAGWLRYYRGGFDEVGRKLAQRLSDLPALQELIKATGSRDLGILFQAAVTAGYAGASGIPVLQQIFAYTDHSERTYALGCRLRCVEPKLYGRDLPREAAYGAGQEGESGSAVPELPVATTPRQWVLRQAALGADRSGELGIPVLEWIVSNTADLVVLRVAAKRAGIAGRSGIPLLDRILSVSNDPRVLRQAALGAGHAGSSGLLIYEHIIDRTDDLKVMKSVAWGAGNMGESGIPLLERIITKVDDPELLREAARGAGCAGKTATPVLEWIVSKTRDPQVLREAARGAGGARQAGIPLLEWIVARADDPEVLRQAATRAGETGEPGFPVLTWIVARTADPEVLRLAAASAGYRAERGLPVLDWIVSQTLDSEVLRQVAESAHYSGESGIPVLERIVANTDNPEVLQQAAKSAHYGGESGIPVLQCIVTRTKSLEVLQIAARGAGEAGESGIPVLERIVAKTDDPEVLREAADGAARAGEPGIPVLEWLLERGAGPEVVRASGKAALMHCQFQVLLWLQEHGLYYED